MNRPMRPGPAAKCGNHLVAPNQPVPAVNQLGVGGNQRRHVDAGIAVECSEEPQQQLPARDLRIRR